jgi:hypothetical protein
MIVKTPRLAAALFSLIMIMSSMPAAAANVNLNGYWEGFMGGSRVNDEYPWNIWRPAQYFELKLFSGLSDRSEIFVKFGGRWDGFNNPGDQPRMDLKEGHIKYRRDWGGKGFESFVFTRERRYWIGNHLLQLVDEGNVSNDNNAQGIRFDAWRGDWNANYILSDFSNQDDAETEKVEKTDDVHILRLTRRLSDKGSYIGGSYLRRTYSSPAQQYNEVRSMDFLWIANLVDLSAEIADTKNPGEDLSDDSFDGSVWRYGSLGQSFERWLPSDAAFRAEARNLTLGNPRLGHYTINSGYWFTGPDYLNGMGRDATDRVGHFFHTYYQLPQRAVTYTLSWGRERRWNAFLVSDQFGDLTNTNDPRSWINQNLYIEFINGFKVSIAHNRATNTFLGVEEEHFDWFGELIVENRLAWLNGQRRHRGASHGIHADPVPPP